MNTIASLSLFRLHPACALAQHVSSAGKNPLVDQSWLH